MVCCLVMVVGLKAAMAQNISKIRKREAKFQEHTNFISARILVNFWPYADFGFTAVYDSYLNFLLMCTGPN